MIRTKIYLSVWLLLICGTVHLVAQSASGANGAVPGMVKFAGALNDAKGEPLTGTVGVTFLLYKEPSGGAPLWMETQNVSADKTGRYSVLLGSTTNQGLPADAFVAGEARWIGVQIGGQTEQARVQLVSVPYALKAADAQTLGGLPASAFLLATPSAGTIRTATQGSLDPNTATAVTTAGGTAQSLAKFDGAADIASSQLFDDGANVGIGTNTPKAKLDVKGAAFVRGTFTLPATGNSTASGGKSSQAENFVASSFNRSSATPVNQIFRWQAEPANNNTASPSATLNLLYGTDTNSLVETGLRIGPKGIFAFAPGQTFPGVGTVKSVGLSAPASDFSVSGSPVTSSGTLNLQWLVAPASDSTPNAIVKRDAFGGFSAGSISVGALNTNGDINAAGFITATRTVFANILSASTSLATDGIAAVNGFANDAGPESTSGVFGQSMSDSGHGVSGLIFGTNAAGVFGEARTAAANSSGVMGVSDGDGNGVAAINNARGDGLFATSSTGFAAFFLGDVDVDGRLSKAAGSFKIDHPLDPANKYLYHSFVESPDMMNVYNGNVVTDGQGKAEVEMPEWFEALNRDFRYQLTTIGQLAQATVLSEMANHRFTILTDQPNVKVSWQVTGIRQDVYANAHRIPVEEKKSDKERELYLHPELFGKSQEKSIASVRHAGALKMAKEGNVKLADSVKP